MDSVDKWMSKRHLPKSLRSRIGHHYQEVRSHSLANLLRASRAAQSEHAAHTQMGKADPDSDQME